MGIRADGASVQCGQHEFDASSQLLTRADVDDSAKQSRPVTHQLEAESGLLGPPGGDAAAVVVDRQGDAACVDLEADLRLRCTAVTDRIRKCLLRDHEHMRRGILVHLRIAVSDRLDTAAPRIGDFVPRRQAPQGFDQPAAIHADRAQPERKTADTFDGALQMLDDPSDDPSLLASVANSKTPLWEELPVLVLLPPRQRWKGQLPNTARLLGENSRHTNPILVLAVLTL